nr:MAG TPA: hypothetical protein [Caudoviricetes sp.]
MKDFRLYPYCLTFNHGNMKTIKEVIKEIEHIPKCPRSGEVNLYHIIKLKRNELH